MNDLINLERGPEALVKLALYPLAIVVTCGAIGALLNELRPVDVVLVFLVLLLLSPLAYLIREARGGHGRERGGSRRGAERTPLLPTNEEFE